MEMSSANWSYFCQEKLTKIRHFLILNNQTRKRAKVIFCLESHLTFISKFEIKVTKIATAFSVSLGCTRTLKIKIERVDVPIQQKNELNISLIRNQLKFLRVF